MSDNPFKTPRPGQFERMAELHHEGLHRYWDPERAGGMTWEEFDDQSKTMSVSAYLNYECRQAPMFSEREDQIIAAAFGEEFAQELRAIHEGRYDQYQRPARQNRVGRFVGKVLDKFRLT